MKRTSKKPGSVRSSSFPHFSRFHTLIWAFIGLFLTIGGTFIEASITNFPWHWGEKGVEIYSLQVNYQTAAVLFVACLGGQWAGVLAQLAYILVGLTILPVFTQGGGWGYIQHPAFGYLIGFIPGAWICGKLAFRKKATLELLGFSCLCGLGTIHTMGIIYLIGLELISPVGEGFIALWQGFLQYSIFRIPGQLVLTCAVSVLAFVLRRMLFY